MCSEAQGRVRIVGEMHMVAEAVLMGLFVFDSVFPWNRQCESHTGFLRCSIRLVQMLAGWGNLSAS